MESCHEKSNISNESYQRVKDLVCQSKIPYKGPLLFSKKIERNNYLLLLLLLIIIFIFFRIYNYQRGATNLFK